ncbi:hypothetical protein P168DRAFT_118516 [Aspergillus campestris IBT 28561]|uniref:Uncharacterized protein n=1 Tax=Aspergillus campestris (strain IBT 28561) TaxID=1392248 RepID=A0A2I1DA81_ASPC2|nr:uncharacterized protein P168DRAFT_118516 [Aspergillus campestris IBT 28561]PKY06779.1 hypothetical protein P168DRAFT_118516 [Aspergillus campestris IBT 28561]
MVGRLTGEGSSNRGDDLGGLCFPRMGVRTMKHDGERIHETERLEQIRPSPGTAPPLITDRKDEEEEAQESKRGGQRPGG